MPWKAFEEDEDGISDVWSIKNHILPKGPAIKVPKRQ